MNPYQLPQNHFLCSPAWLTPHSLIRNRFIVGKSLGHRLNFLFGPHAVNLQVQLDALPPPSPKVRTFYQLYHANMCGFCVNILIFQARNSVVFELDLSCLHDLSFTTSKSCSLATNDLIHCQTNTSPEEELQNRFSPQYYG